VGEKKGDERERDNEPSIITKAFLLMISEQTPSPLWPKNY
jgi:hypothetical protein